MALNGNQHNMGYYLVDGIYPNWPVFVKTFKHAIGPKKSYFASRQEGARKDVERAFGVLQSRWGMVKGPARQWYIPNIGDIMCACIILHNMIVESEGDKLTQWTNEEVFVRSHSGRAPLETLLLEIELQVRSLENKA
ncbi:uncharacterized protein LOC125194125 [Salvia hispanica]|uniref:uncharacterized protein LOC125194125 n=1 Tax=Salvia hispanica TaxID=49212 RepID=UPI00200958CE|nr:uncharacterized protein LOC125194125 [Salvia hispanica]